MPLFLLKFLPLAGKYLAIALALFMVYRHIAKGVETRMNLERAVQAAMLVKIKDGIEKTISANVTAIDQQTGETIRQIETVRSTVIRPTIEREIIREVRLSDPDAGITDSLLQALNRSRQLSGDPGPNGSITIALPGPEPVN
jgi:hypothetical protein